MPAPRLQPSEREFFAALDDVVYGNPFSDEREKIIQRLVPGATPVELLRDPDALRRIVEPRLAAYSSLAHLERLDEKDRKLMLSGSLSTSC